MSRPRRFLLLSLAAVVVGLVVGVWLLWPRPSAINPQNAAKIERGMTLAEVEAILGGPARDESTGPTERLPVDWTAHSMHLEGPTYPRVWRWDSDAAHVEVVGADPDTIWFAHWWPMRRQPEGVLDTLRRWLGL